jgi:uncharacterized protein GlcG (DUF336 family)
MIRSLTLISALALAATTGTLFAQQPPAGQQPPAPPARGVESALALEAVQAAVSACLGEGIKGSAAVVDSAGVLRVLVSADGSSSEIFSEMEKDAALKAKLEADKTVFARPGALPIMAGNDVIGAIGFGGANQTQGGGAKDEACAKAGLDKIKARVK